MKRRAVKPEELNIPENNQRLFAFGLQDKTIQTTFIHQSSGFHSGKAKDPPYRRAIYKEVRR
jgi:hypothetical protein